MTKNTLTALAAVAFATAAFQMPVLADTNVNAGAHAHAKIYAAPNVKYHPQKVVRLVPKIHHVAPRIHYVPRYSKYAPHVYRYAPRVTTYTPHFYRYAPRVTTYSPVVAAAPIVSRTYYAAPRPQYVSAPVCMGMWSGQIMLPKMPGRWSVAGLGAVLINEDGSAVLDCSKNSAANLKVASNDQPPCLGQWSGVVRIENDKPGSVQQLGIGSAQVTAEGRIILACVAKP